MSPKLCGQNQMESSSSNSVSAVPPSRATSAIFLTIGNCQWPCATSKSEVRTACGSGRVVPKNSDGQRYARVLPQEVRACCGNGEFELELRVSRTAQPGYFGDLPDDRELSVAVCN